MQNKSLFLSIVVGLAILVGMQDLFVSIFGQHDGYVITAFIILAYQVCLVVLKKIWNSGNWMKGWDTAFIVVNILTVIPMAIATFQAWSADYSVEVNQKVIDILGKIIVACNSFIVLFSANWQKLRDDLAGSLENGERPQY